MYRAVVLVAAVAFGCSTEKVPAPIVPLAPPPAQIVEQVPTEWPGITGRWLPALPGKPVWVSADSFIYRRADTIRALVRNDILDDHTSIERVEFVCGSNAIRTLYTRSYWKGHKPELKRPEGWFAEWDTIKAGSIAARQRLREICSIAQRGR